MKKRMKKHGFLVMALVTLAPLAALAGGADDPLLAKLMVDRLEARDGEEASAALWEADAWIGRDIDKLWIKASGESVDGGTVASEVDLLYSRAISPFWDLQAGFRRQFEPGPSRDWVGAGFRGEAPYLLETDINLFVDKDSQAELRIEFEYEYMLSRRWVLLPALEGSLFSKNEPELGIGSGLASLELGLRLAYEINRQIAPYLGVQYEKQFGNTADYSEAAGDPDSETFWVAGLGFWF
jgi:copper resistance protein B